MSTPEQDAKLDLIILNVLASMEQGLVDSDPILLEVCKALSLVMDHGEIEAKVVCRTSSEVVRALVLLHRPTWQTREHAKWNTAERCLELPNGSAVSVWLNGKRMPA